VPVYSSAIIILNLFCSVVLSTPERTPKKKSKLAVPGSPEFESLTPVSIAPGLKPTGLFGKKLSFGSTEDAWYANSFCVMN
jgi:hypothetical protein